MVLGFHHPQDCRTGKNLEETALRCARLQTPLTLDPDEFHRHYEIRRALPFTLLTGMTTEQIARYNEVTPGWAGVDLEVLPVRIYPQGTTAAHVLGHLKKDNHSVEGEQAFYTYRLPITAAPWASSSATTTPSGAVPGPNPCW